MTNSNSNFTPGAMFRSLLVNSAPAALAWVRGGVSYPDISGLVKFFHTPYGGILVEAEIFNLPNINIAGSSNFYAMHIHEYGNCSADFAKTGGHYGAPGSLHPNHAGDMPPLLASQGYAWMSFYDKRFSIEDILDRSVVIHQEPDDFKTQPSGNSGAMIACGVIRPYRL